MENNNDHSPKFTESTEGVVIANENIISKRTAAQRARREREMNVKVIPKTKRDALPHAAGELNEPVISKRTLAQRLRRGREKLIGKRPCEKCGHHKESPRTVHSTESQLQQTSATKMHSILPPGNMGEEFFTMLFNEGISALSKPDQLESTHHQPRSTCLSSISGTSATLQNEGVAVEINSTQLEPTHLQPSSTCSFSGENASTAPQNKVVVAEIKLPQLEPTHLQSASMCSFSFSSTCAASENEGVAAQLESPQLQPSSMGSFSISSTCAALENEGVAAQLESLPLQPPSMGSFSISSTSATSQNEGVASQLEMPPPQPPSRGSFSISSTSSASQNEGVAAQLEWPQPQPPSICSFSIPNTSEAQEIDMLSISKASQLGEIHLQPPSTCPKAVNIGDKSLISKRVSTQLLQRETEKHEKIISNCTTTDALLSGAGELNEPIVPKRVLAQRKRRERERLAGVLLYPLPPRYFPSLVPTARVLAARRRRSEMQKEASNGANLSTLPSSKNGIQPSVLMEISQHSSKQAKVMHSPASPSEQHILPETPTEMDNTLCNETTPEMDCTYLKNTVDAMSSQLQQVRQEDIHSIPPPEKTGEKFLMSEPNEGVLAQLKSDQMEPIHHRAPFTCSSSMLRTSATAQNENSASQLNSAQLELIHPQISSVRSFSVEVTFTVPQKGVTTEINSAQLDPTNLQPPSTSSLSISSMSAVPQKGGVATQLEPTHLQRLSTCSLSMPNRSAASKNDMRSISELPLLEPRHFQPPSTSFKAMDIDNENIVSKRVLAQRLRRGREKNEKGIHKCTTTDALPVSTGKINQSTVSNLRVSRGELNQPTVSNLRVSRRELNHPTVYSLPVSRWGLNHPTVSNLPVSRGELNQPTVSNLRVSRSDLNQPTVSNLPVSGGELNHPTISNLPVTRRELNHPTVSNLPVSRGELNQPTVSNLPVARGELNQPTVSNRPVAMESTVSKHGPQRSPREWLRLVRVLPLPPKYLRSLIPSVRVFSQRRWSEMEREANMQKTSTLSSITNRIQPSDVADVPQHLPKRPKITTSLPSSSAQNTLQDTSTQSDYATCKGTPLSVDTMEGHPRQTSQAVLHSMPLSRNTGEKCLMKESNEGVSYQMEPAQLQPCSTSSSSILSTSAALRNEDPVQQPPSACSFSMENTSIDPQIRGIAAQREASQLEASDLEPFSRGSFSMLRTSAAPQIGVAAQLEQTHLQPPSTCLFSLRNTFAAPENDMPIISESPQLEPGHLQPHSTCSKLLSKNAKITTSLPASYAQDTLQDTPTRSHYATCKETLLSVDTMIGHLQQTSQAGLHSPLLPRNTGKTLLIKEFSEDISDQMEPTQLQPCSTFSSSILSTAAALHNEGPETQQMSVEFELVHVQQPPATCLLFMDNTSIDPQLGGTAAQTESSQFEAPDLEPLSRGSFSMLSASAAPQIGVAAQLEQTHFEPPSTCLFSLPNTSAALENDTPSISESQNLDPRHLQPPSTSYTFAAPENDMPSISESSKLEPRHLQSPSPYSKKKDAPKELNINLRPPTQEVGCRIPRKKAEEYRVKNLHSAVAVLKKKARSFPVPSIFQRRKAGR